MVYIQVRCAKRKAAQVLVCYHYSPIAVILNPLSKLAPAFRLRWLGVKQGACDRREVTVCPDACHGKFKQLVPKLPAESNRCSSYGQRKTDY